MRGTPDMPVAWMALLAEPTPSGVWVHARRGLVQEDDAGPAQECYRDAELPSLAAGQLFRPRVALLL